MINYRSCAKNLVFHIWSLFYGVILKIDILLYISVYSIYRLALKWIFSPSGQKWVSVAPLETSSSGKISSVEMAIHALHPGDVLPVLRPLHGVSHYVLHSLIGHIVRSPRGGVNGVKWSVRIMVLLFIEVDVYLTHPVVNMMSWRHKSQGLWRHKSQGPVSI